ncbi:hypothetical protein K432DRAFT_471340 [Lepidopterella palustris CBS 459.81]|uniref:Uncharacterized protein n=1 Tax=Lepidopterella palustris CBS 459.81 TaxID=1314670 RepID=A0A8E2JHG5_9PEZI|nr:hypothetical protein K432DRAFT_471340 [Lepidopterella palustris CBS 459.81]
MDPPQDDQDHSAQPANLASDAMGLIGRFPGEIRNRLYRFVLYQDVERAGVWVGSECRNCRQSERPPVLAQACAQIRREVSSIYYRENPFTWDNSAHACYPFVHHRCGRSVRARCLPHYLTPLFVIAHDPSRSHSRACNAVLFQEWIRSVGSEGLSWMRNLRITFTHCVVCNPRQSGSSWNPNVVAVFECDVLPAMLRSMAALSCE